MKIGYKLGILGYGCIAEIAWYLGFKDLVVIQLLDQHAQLDPRWNGTGFSYPPEVKVIPLDSPQLSRIKFEFRGSDLIAGISFQQLGAQAAERLGVPYISGDIITVCLPEGIQYRELKIPYLIPEQYLIPISRYLQLKVALDLLAGREFPLAPQAIQVTKQGIRKLNLELRS